MTSALSARVRTFLTCFALSAMLVAQLAGASPSSSNSESPSEEIVSLPEFTVSTAETGQYVASETMTGSRVKERIEKLPYVVNVVTSEFLKDFAFFDMHDEEFTMATSAYVPADSPNGGMQIRGQGALKTLRNGFARVGAIVDSVNIDRIEVIRGPSATVYGENRPGGIVNVISKRPKTRPGYRMSAGYGSYDFSRVELEATGPLGAARNTYYLFTASNQERRYEQEFSPYRRRTLSGSVSHVISTNTNILVELEHLKQHTAIRPTVSMVNDASAPATQRVQRLVTLEESPRGFNHVGPNTVTDREVNSGTATLEHRINSILSLRAALAFFDIDRTDFTNTYQLTYELTGPNAGTFGSRVPGWGYIDEESYMAQVDLLAQYKLLSGSIDAKSLFTVDFSNNYHVDPQYALPSSGVNSVADLSARSLYSQRVRTGVTPFNLTKSEVEKYTTRITRYRQNRVADLGLLFRQQIGAWRGRFIASAGGRFDIVQFRMQDKLQEKLTNNPARNIVENTDDNTFTPNAGLNYAIAPGIRAYLNYAKSYYVDTQNRTAGATVQTNEGGYGWDYGCKFSFLDQRLSLTLGGWYIERTNVTVTEFDEERLISVQKTVGGILSRGVEFDANWRMTDSVSATFGGSHLSSIFTENGRDRDSLGRQQPRLPKNSAYTTIRYAGPIRGFSMHIGMSYTGESSPYTTSGAIIEPASSPQRGLIVSHNGARNIMIPSYYAVRLGGGYTWRAKDSPLNNTVSINVINPLNRRYILNSGRWNEPFNIVGTYTVKF